MKLFEKWIEAARVARVELPFVFVGEGPVLRLAKLYIKSLAQCLFKLSERDWKPARWGSIPELENLWTNVMQGDARQIGKVKFGNKRCVIVDDSGGSTLGSPLARHMAKRFITESGTPARGAGISNKSQVPARTAMS